MLRLRERRPKRPDGCFLKGGAKWWILSVVLFILIVVFYRRRSRVVLGERCYALSAKPSELAQLTELDLGNCDLRELPAAIGYCTNLQVLNLGGNPKLTSLPDELSNCSELTTLFISGARGLTSLPLVLGKLPALTRLGLRSNGLTHIPAAAVPKNVLHLILTDNELTTIDGEVFERLTKVRKLMLANNKLEFLPSTVAKMQSLELIRLANNRLSSLPPELLRLPKLSWLAISGNPLSPPAPPPLVPMTVKLAEVEIDLSPTGKLGSGASGEVRKAMWRGKPVAVKRFQAVTSDGRPEDEISLIAAVSHPHLIPVAGAAAAEKVVLMERLPANLHSLGGPPTIVEITSSRYPDSVKFTPQMVLRITRSLASALEYLHSRHIAHGDIYAHNTLLDEEANEVRLCDFGAAFAYRDNLYPALIQAIEVRAFGVLMGDLVARLTPPTPTEPANFRVELQSLVSVCQGPADSRPTFSAIFSRLDTFSTE